jgi:hypothetical protein
MTRPPFFEPAGLSRQERRALKRTSSPSTGERTQRNSRRDRSLPEPAVRGPYGPGLIEGGYWNLAPAWVPAHQATSQHLARPSRCRP